MLPSGALDKPFELKLSSGIRPGTGNALAQPGMVRQRSNTALPSSGPPAGWNSGPVNVQAPPTTETPLMSATYTPMMRAGGPQVAPPPAVVDSIMANEQGKAFPMPVTLTDSSSGMAVHIAQPHNPDLPGARPIVRTGAAAPDASKLPPVRRTTLGAVNHATLRSHNMVNQPSLQQTLSVGSFPMAATFNPASSANGGQTGENIMSVPSVAVPQEASSTAPSRPMPPSPRQQPGSPETDSPNSASPTQPGGRRPLLRAPTNNPAEAATLDPKPALTPCVTSPPLNRQLNAHFFIK